jgi:hypothetical protein
VFRRWVVFLFTTELVTERGITDDYYTDRRVLSVRPSVIISPTEFIPVTDGMSQSVKLFNDVVEVHTPPLFLQISEGFPAVSCYFLGVSAVILEC